MEEHVLRVVAREDGSVAISAIEASQDDPFDVVLQQATEACSRSVRLTRLPDERAVIIQDFVPFPPPGAEPVAE